ncbi:hypothetical protein [Aquimarina sp. AU58]|uniref:hypothetical protein n=1 Tax=Aquimarina sp. AU58 TaxID=1874112 RepID=UPI00135CE2CF|nr:hypothetical protein [Aquimarina sp. AU58]
MKRILIFVIICMMNKSMAQNKENIVGLYALGSHSPEGGSHLFVLENGKFVITYFGGVQVGNWRIDRDQTFLFTPNTKKNEFELYGRYNKKAQNSLKISFMGFEESRSFVCLKKSKDDHYIMKQVFNDDANCFGYPYVGTFKKDSDVISFMAINEGMNTAIYDFNIKGLNDFIACFFTRENEAYPFYVTLKDNKLYIDENEYSEKHPLPTEGEDIEFIRAIANKNTSETVLLYNSSYNHFKEDINANHIFDKEKQAYIIPGLYKEGNENRIDDEAFFDMSIIYKYELCTGTFAKSVDYKIEDKPIFQVNCK